MYKSVLEIGDQKYYLNNLNLNAYGLDQEQEESYSGNNNISFSIRKTDQALWDWVINDPRKKKSLTVRVYETDDNQPFMTISVKNAMCASYSLNHYATNENGPELNLTVNYEKSTVKIHEKSQASTGGKRDE